MPFIQRRIELSRTSYVFAARRMDIFLVVRIASMARMTLLSFGRTDMLHGRGRGRSRRDLVVRAESAQGDGVRRVMVDHVILNQLKLSFHKLRIFI